MQIELFALLRGEGRSLVVHRVAEQLRTAVGRLHRGSDQGIHNLHPYRWRRM